MDLQAVDYLRELKLIRLAEIKRELEKLIKILLIELSMLIAIKRTFLLTKLQIFHTQE